MATDRSGFRYQTRDLTRSEKLKLNMMVLDLKNHYPIEHTFLMLIQDFIYTRICPSALAEYYKGAHVVFNDQGVIYTELRQFASAPETTSYYRYAMDTDVPNEQRQQPYQLSSHYMVSLGFPTGDEVEYPQIGIDLPTGGHILFGLVPDEDGTRANGNTFVQTKGFGFQSYRSMTMLGWGTLACAVDQGSIGLLGYSPHSEKQRKEIREHERDGIPYEQLIFEARMPPFDWEPLKQRIQNSAVMSVRQDVIVRFLLESGLEEAEFENYIDPNKDMVVDIEYRCPRTGDERIYSRRI